jgi:predicted O-methyltransferase YrrM
VADNCLYFGKVLGEGEIPAKKHRTIVVNLRKFIDKIKNDERLTDTTIYEFDDGVLVTNLKQGE